MISLHRPLYEDHKRLEKENLPFGDPILAEISAPMARNASLTSEDLLLRCIPASFHEWLPDRSGALRSPALLPASEAHTGTTYLPVLVRGNSTPVLGS